MVIRPHADVDGFSEQWGPAAPHRPDPGQCQPGQAVAQPAAEPSPRLIVPVWKCVQEWSKMGGEGQWWQGVVGLAAAVAVAARWQRRQGGWVERQTRGCACRSTP